MRYQSFHRIRGTTPFDAREEIASRFDGLVPDEIREELIDELEEESLEWAGRASDDYVLEAIEPPSEHIKAFTAGIENIRKLIKARVDANEQQFFQRLLYASVITALETYLSDKFVSSITNNPKSLRKFVETFPRFEKETIKLGDIFTRWENLERQVRKTLLTEIVWHRLEIVGKMFSATFGVDFPKPQDLGDLLRAIETRHDLVHRSGKDKEGVEHNITPKDIETLIAMSNTLVTHIDRQTDKFSADDKRATDENGGPEDEIPF